jgi:hypothetical protein
MSETNQQQVTQIVNNVIKECLKLVPGGTDEDKKKWCVKRVTELLEAFDNAIPVIGILLDNPLIDQWESKAIEMLVGWAWDRRPREFMVDSHPIEPVQEDSQVE